MKRKSKFKYDDRYDAQTNLALQLLKDDENIPIDQKCEGSCIANTGECGVNCPNYLDGKCPIQDEIDELLNEA